MDECERSLIGLVCSVLLLLVALVGSLLKEPAAIKVRSECCRQTVKSNATSECV